MTFNPSFRISSCPGLSPAGLSPGCRFTFTLRPCARMLTVPSSFAERYTPYVEGGAHSLSTSSFSAVICSRLVERVHQLLVLVEGLDELAVRLAQLALEDHEVLRRVLELLAQVNGLGLERADVGLEVLDLDLVLRE